MQTSIGLVLALVSAVAVNWAYAREHDAAASLPPLTFREPRASLLSLLSHRQWVLAFGTETAAWLVYVAALRLAPLSLVQAVCASGIAVLAFTSAGGHPSRLCRREQVAVVVAFAGLVMLSLSLSLVDAHQSDRAPNAIATVVWLGACGGAAAASALSLAHRRVSRAAAFGLSAGLLFAAGDITAKLIGYGGAWLLALVPLVAAYGAGTSMLQGAFQHGDALTAAGVATLATNAVPIASGFVLFDEDLPANAAGALQLAAFATIVVSATLLGRPGAGGSVEAEGTGEAEDSRAVAAG